MIRRSKSTTTATEAKWRQPQNEVVVSTSTPKVNEVHWRKNMNEKGMEIRSYICDTLHDGMPLNINDFDLRGEKKRVYFSSMDFEGDTTLVQKNWG